MQFGAFVLLIGLSTITDEPCVLDGFAQLLRRGEGIAGRPEAAAFVIRANDGTVRFLLWPRYNLLRSATYRGAVPAGTIAIAHTHPPDIERPSPGDVAQSMRLGLPIYVISHWHIWTVDPASGAHVHVAMRGWWQRSAERQGCASPRNEKSIRTP